MKKLLLALLLYVAVQQDTSAQKKTDPSHRVPAEKNLSAGWKQSLYSTDKKVYKGDELLTIGMPCGGIAAGQLYVRGDGTLANWWIANNAYNTGYGIDSKTHFKTAMGPWTVCYHTFEPASYISQGFSLTVGDRGKEQTFPLDKTGFDDISFTGEYPVATIDYASRTRKLPVSIRSEVYSPFIPMNARESATPATILKYTITNTSRAAVKLSLEGWLQNLVCLEIAPKLNADSRNRIVRDKGMTSVVMDLVPAKGNAEPQKYFPLQHPYFGNLSLSVLSGDGFADADHADIPRQDSAFRPVGQALVGAVGKSFTLRPGEKKEIVFLLTWYFPNRPSYYVGSDVTNVIPNDWNQALPTDGTTIIGNMYSNWYSSSLDVAQYLRNNFRHLNEETYNFHKTYYENTNLPAWLVKRTLMPLSILATETCQWWANGKFWAWEGVGSCVGTCTHVWNYEQALAHFFPELERNIRERTDFGESFQKDGSILARNGWGGVLIDGHAGAVLKAYREYLNSRDAIFLWRNWDRIKRATEFIISEDGNEDGLIEKTQANTYDIAFYGANTYVGSLYLACLKAAERMAVIMNDSSFSARCKRISGAGEKNSVSKLWNGEYFIQQVDLQQHPEFQYATGCLSDQLFGQTWNHLNHLGYIYPKEMVQQTLRSIWKYNWAPDVALQNRIHPPERTYANAGEAGLFVCTWPFSAHMGEKGVRYRDEVWTGIEYQVATNMIYENMIDEGLSVVKAVDDRYSPRKHNPWNEVECGDHYARAMASWGVMMALQDYYYNGPEKILGFSPKINAADFESFFTAAEGWGNISQKRQPLSQNNIVDVKYGTVHLQQLNLSAAKQPKSIQVFANSRKIGGTFDYSDNNLSVHFDETVLNAGDKLSVNILF